MQKYSQRNVSAFGFALVTLILLGKIECSPQPLSLQISRPTLNNNFIPLAYEVPSKNKSLTLGFPDINFQISSSIYTAEGNLEGESLYRPSQYSGSLNQFCDMYPTTIITDTKVRMKYPENVENLKYTVYHHNLDQGSVYYMLGSDSKLYVYGFDRDVVSLQGKFEVQYSISLIKDQQLQSNVQLFVVAGRLFLANKQNLYIFDQANKDKQYFTKVEGYEASQKLVDIGLAEEGPEPRKLTGNKIWVCKQKQVVVYQINETANGVTLIKKSEVQGGMDTISAITYDIDIQIFYIVSGHTLVTLQRVSEQRDSQFQLQGICTHITKIRSTLYLGCRYDRINFVAEIRVQNGGVNMVLNRYYDDSVVEGIRDVQYLGYDKIAIIGDEQSLVIGEAINRNTLLDLSNRKTQQKYQYVFSFGLMDIFYLPQFSTPQHSTILVIGESSISVHSIIYEAPQLQCNFHERPHPDVISVLVVFNTSHCPFPVGDQLVQAGTYAQCQTFYPFRIQFSKKQYEEKTARFIFFVIMLLLIVGVLLCTGLGVKIRNEANGLILSMRNKIEKIKMSHQNSEMKKL